MKFTSLEQSKKLAKILPLESADMTFCGKDDVLTTPYLKTKESLLACFAKEGSLHPCWSLAALLNVLPKSVRLEGSQKEPYWYCEVVKANDPLYPGFKSANDPVDACYELIIQLNDMNVFQL